MDETNPMESTAVETVSTEPVTLATEGTDPTFPDESIPETTVETVAETLDEVPGPPVTPEPEEQDGTFDTIYEDFSGTEYEETVAVTEEVPIADVIETVGSDIAHASLFSGFLVSGTLVGIFLLRKVYGS